MGEKQERENHLELKEKTEQVTKKEKKVRKEKKRKEKKKIKIVTPSKTLSNSSIEFEKFVLHLLIRKKEKHFLSSRFFLRDNLKIPVFIKEMRKGENKRRFFFSFFFFVW